MAKIMLVEDDNNLREIYEARLQAEGYTIVAAKDGEEALVIAKAEQPELIISDVMMPKISGFEMLDILRNTDGLKDVKVIMLTALGQADDQQRATRLGADRYLVKSQVTLEDIVNAAHQLLEDAPAAAPAPIAAPVQPVTPLAVNPLPVAAAPDPVAAPVPAPAPDSPPVVAAVPTPVVSVPPSAPEPTATPAPVSDTPDPAADAESTSDETADVEARIEDFVSGATSEATTPAPNPASPEPTVTFTSNAPAPSAEPSAPSANRTSDDKVMATALDSLTAGVPGAAVPETPDVLLNAVQPADDDRTTSDDESANPVIAGKKRIMPIDSAAKPDLNQLLALEEAKETAAANATAVTPAPTSPTAVELSAAPVANAPVVPAPPAPVANDPNNIAL